MAHKKPRRCKQNKADGIRCRANALLDSDYCFAHDPTRAAARQAARQAGGRVGKTKVLPAETPDAPLACSNDVVVLLGATINQVRRGQLDPKVANTVGYLAGTLMKALQQGEIDRRLAQLEAAVETGPTGQESLFDVDLDDDAEPPPDRKAIA